ncbi:deleted in malignant brain tumors 1 -like protein [Labeo rohita]|uniref:Deleted in malignant brain tumors 1-like protein n=1 Tax=Labeo rohita TaxID=84645 RepID=A0A498NK75_LABRO|nr:deleted in malignant brain tumors 1 -like protein [Labeo rohita]
MPTLFLTSTHAVVSHGENIQFRCTTPKPRCNVNAEFQLFRNGLSVSSQTHVSSVTFNHNVDVSHQGSYSCQYSYQNHIKSLLSNTVNITVVNLQQPSISHSAPDGQFVMGSKGPVITRGHSFTIICSTESQYPGGSFHLFRGSNITRSELQMPTLSLTSTNAVVTRGENIQFRCTTPKPRCNVNAEFQLFRNGLSVSSQTHVSSVTFNHNVDVSHQSSYSCQYSYQNNIKSLLSNTVNITVVDLQQPSISHSAPDGQFVVGSQGPVITRGHSFTIICSTESQYPGGSFHLFRGSIITRSELQMPNLSLTSTHAVVSHGENIQFRCTTPKPRCNVNAEFQLFRNGLSVSSQKHVSSVTFNHNIDVSHQGSYSCQYSYQNNIKSPLSNTVNITVVNLQQPSISHSAPDAQFLMGPQGPVITRGHSFTIICSTESQYPGGSFHLFRGSNITRSELQMPTLFLTSTHAVVFCGENIQFRCTTPKPRCNVNAEFQLFRNGLSVSSQTHVSSVTFNHNVDISHQGSYSCQYSYQNNIKSPLSNTVNITVVNLQQPSISHSAPDGQFVVGSQGPVITRGHSFTIICFTESQYPGGSFHLFRGSNITRSELQMPTLSLTSKHAVVSRGENIQFRCTTPKPRCNANAEFQLFRNGLSVSSQKHVSSVTFNHNVDVSHQGNYSCQYSYQNNIKSPLSNTVNFTVVDLQQPSISHSAPDGQFVVGSQGPVITRGHSFTIICSTESQYPGGSFHLFRGSNITRSELQMPTLSLTSTHAVVSHGENIQFRCTTPKPRCNVNAEFQLFGNGLSVSSQTHVSSVTFNHNVDISHQGSYSCQYSYQNNIKSPLSNTVNFTVVNLQQPSISHSAPDGQFVVGSQGPVITRGHSFTIICSTESQYPGGSFHLFRGSNITRSELQMPTLSLTSTHAVVSRGENIQFICTTAKPRCNVNAEFQLFRNGLSVSSQTHVSSVTFNHNVDISHQGSYSCQYSYQNSIKSPLSNTVNITVVDLQRPSISHSAPDGQFVVGSQGPVITRGHSFTIICSTESQFPGGSFHLFRGSNITRMNLQQPSISHRAPDAQFVVGSQGPVITRGHSFTIICSTESQYPGGSFHLFRGSNITRSESAVNHSSSFSFPEADYSHEGNYSCVYEVSVSSRSFSSSASELLLITITASLLPVIGAAVSAVLLLLSVLIIILLLKRRQKQRKYSFRKGAAN